MARNAYWDPTFLRLAFSALSEFAIFSSISLKTVAASRVPGSPARKRSISPWFAKIKRLLASSIFLRVFLSFHCCHATPPTKQNIPIITSMRANVSGHFQEGAFSGSMLPESTSNRRRISLESVFCIIGSVEYAALWKLPAGF